MMMRRVPQPHGLENARRRAALVRPKPSLNKAAVASSASGVPLFLQLKTAVSQPHDPAELEADRMADRVMRMESAQGAHGTAPMMLQRASDAVPASDSGEGAHHDEGSRCPSWRHDPQSLSKRAAETYVQHDMTPPSLAHVERIECEAPLANGNYGCHVHFSDGLVIRVIVREKDIVVGTAPIRTLTPPPATPLCFYDYACPEGQLVLTLKECKSAQVTGAARPAMISRRPAASDTPGRIGAMPRVSRVLATPGQPLDPATRTFFESRFGQEFSHVRVHTDPEAQKSAADVNALAYTVGPNVVFGAGRYAPGTPEGQWLLAHELTHVLQQGGRSRAQSAETTVVSERVPGGADVSQKEQASALPAIQRTADSDVSRPCDQHHVDDLIDPAFTEARRWRRQASAWLESHLDHIRARGRMARDGYVTVGRSVYDELMLLERHFRIRSVLRIALPYAPDERVSVEDLERLGNASYWVRRRFRDVELSPSYVCQANCPRGRTGSDTLGSAVAGSREVTFYTNCFDRQHETTRAGVALHEAFHATFSEFNHDTYSFEGSYPGGDALTNAESFATFAAIVATGSTYRIIVLPDITIHGGS